MRLKGVCRCCGCCKQRLERGGGRFGCEGTLDVESSKANRDGKFRWVRESATTTQLAGVPTDSFSFERVQPRLSTCHLTSATLDLRVLLSCDLFNSPASYYQTHSTFRILRRGERNNSIDVIAGARYPGYSAHCLLVHRRVKPLTSRCFFSFLLSLFLPKRCQPTCIVYRPSARCDRIS